MKFIIKFQQCILSFNVFEGNFKDENDNTVILYDFLQQIDIQKFKRVTEKNILNFLYNCSLSGKT